MNDMSEQDLRGIPDQDPNSDGRKATSHDPSRVLYIIVCAAPPATEIQDMVKLAMAGGWEVCVITTPEAVNWVNADQLAELTGWPVRSRYRMPDEPEGF